MSDSQDITVYWRPGCGFCSRLLKRLDASAIAYRQVNIWDDPAAASRVRSITGGHETVPTVTVGTVAMVNPRIADIVRLAEPGDEHDRDGSPPASSPPRQIRRAWRRLFGSTG